MAGPQAAARLKCGHAQLCAHCGTLWRTACCHQGCSACAVSIFFCAGTLSAVRAPPRCVLVSRRCTRRHRCGGPAAAARHELARAAAAARAARGAGRTPHPRAMTGEATPLMRNPRASSPFDVMNTLGAHRPSGISTFEVAASVALLSARRLRRRTTLFGSNKVVTKAMGAWGSFLFLSNLITGASALTRAACGAALRACARGVDAEARAPAGAQAPACSACPPRSRAAATSSPAASRSPSLSFRRSAAPSSRTRAASSAPRRVLGRRTPRAARGARLRRPARRATLRRRMRPRFCLRSACAPR